MNQWIGGLLAISLLILIHPVINGVPNEIDTEQMYDIQWQKSYGTIRWWSARYEGPQPIGDCDNDGQNEVLIGGRDPFLRIMEWNNDDQTYHEDTRLTDPVMGIGYRLLFIPQPFGSATGFSVADIDNDGLNEIGVAWGRHFSAFQWIGDRYELMGRYIISDNLGWETTLDCIVGDCDNDGQNEVVVTGGYRESSTPEIIVLAWEDDTFRQESSWNDPKGYSIYFPWIADVDNDGLNEIVCNTNETLVLKYNTISNQWTSTRVASFIDNEGYPFGSVAKDSDGDGLPEIHVTFYTPELHIYEWDGTGYSKKWSKMWPGEEGTIEAIDVGDVDDDGINEVCVGTDVIHILEWDGQEYIEEYVIRDTFGLLAVTAVGDCDNDGKNEIHAGSVGVTHGLPYMAWIFKHKIT
jgi:hypothetical protein